METITAFWFWIDRAYDREYAGPPPSRFRNYLLSRRGAIEAVADYGPVGWCEAVWKTATSPVMHPGLVVRRPRSWRPPSAGRRMAGWPSSSTWRPGPSLVPGLGGALRMGAGAVLERAALPARRGRASPRCALRSHDRAGAGPPGALHASGAGRRRPRVACSGSPDDEHYGRGPAIRRARKRGLQEARKARIEQNRRTKKSRSREQP